MRNLLISSAAALLCATALPAVAAPSANNDTSANSSGQARSAQSRDANRRICIRTQLSSSRIERLVCRTQAEWDRMRANGELDEDNN